MAHLTIIYDWDQLSMPISAPTISIIKGTDDIAAFNARGIRGPHDGNTNMDGLISPQLFTTQGLFINPNALQHAPALLGAAKGMLFNCVTDPDINKQCLVQMQRALKNNPQPIINHPSVVLRTRRHEVAELLSGIPGLIVPKTIMARIRNSAGLCEIMAQERIKFPVLIRNAGSHNQQNLVKLDSQADLEQARYLLGKDCYITEFVDYRSDDGVYRKHRFFIFDTGRVVARHIFMGPSWNVGLPVRKSFMAHKPELRQEESIFLNNFENIIGPRLIQTLRMVRERLGYDFVGMDCNYLSSGELLLFEANAAMNVGIDYLPGSGFEYLRVAYEGVADALSELLLSKLNKISEHPIARVPTTDHPGQSQP